MNFGMISLGGESSLAIVKEAKSYFRESENLDIRKIEVNSNSNNTEVLYNGKKIGDYDCIYVRGSHRYAFLQRSLTEALYHTTYMPLKSRAFALAHNKFLTLLEIQKNKVPIPTTYLAATLVGAKKILERVNYPIIMKIPEGTQGKGVLFADSLASAKSILDTLDVFRQPYIIQEYIETNATDVRALVVGEKVVASYRRKATGQEVRANFHLGALGQECKLDEETKAIAVKVAKSLDAEICAVDMLEGHKTSVIEANLSPGLKGIQKATGKNLSKVIAEYLHKRSEEFREGKKKSDYGKMMNEMNLNVDKEIFANLDIKSGVIRLPKIITKITQFKEDEDIILVADKGKVTIKKVI